MGYFSKFRKPPVDVDPSGCFPIGCLPAFLCCAVSSIYGTNYCPEVYTLRRFRDDHLKHSFFGRSIIKSYYSLSPIIVKTFGNKIWFKTIGRKFLDNIVKILNKSGISNEYYVKRQ